MALSKDHGDETQQSEKIEAQETDYFQKYLRVGKTSPDDAQLEPELQARLAKLYDRQRDEFYNWFYEKKGELSVFPGEGHEYSTPPKILADHREWDKQQNELFFQERDRHIREYHNAKAILAEMNAESREQTLEQQLHQDPKRSY